MNRRKFSKAGDLTPLLKDIEQVFRWHFEMDSDEAAAFAVSFMLPDKPIVHWVTNVSRDDGKTLFGTAFERMET